MHISYKYGMIQPRETTSLKTDDISGARSYPKYSKYSEHYHQRLYNQDHPYENQTVDKNEYPPTLTGNIGASQMIQYPSIDQTQNNRAHSVYRERVMPIRRNPILDFASKTPDPNMRYIGRKHYYEKLAEPNEIQRENIFAQREALNPQLTNFDYPRNLSTQDITGAAPGTLISKVVKNHEVASKIRQSNHIQDDSLDHFQKEYIKPKDPLDDPHWREHRAKNDEYSREEVRKSMEQSAFLTRHQINDQNGSNLDNKDSNLIEMNRLEGLNASTDDYLQKLRASSTIKKSEDKSSPLAAKIQSSYNTDDHGYQGRYRVEDQHKSSPLLIEEERYNVKEDKNYSPESIPQKACINNFDERSKTTEPIHSNVNKYESRATENLLEKPKQTFSQNPTLDIIQKEWMINQQYQQMRKLYSYNIIANESQFKLAPPGTRYTNTVKNSYSFETNTLESKLTKPGVNLESKVAGLSRQDINNSYGVQAYQNSGSSQHGLIDRFDGTELSRTANDMDNQYAGKLNDYGETKNPYLQQAMAVPDKNYGSKALKNISGMRLY